MRYALPQLRLLNRRLVRLQHVRFSAIEMTRSRDTLPPGKLRCFALSAALRCGRNFWRRPRYALPQSWLIRLLIRQKINFHVRFWAVELADNRDTLPAFALALLCGRNFWRRLRYALPQSWLLC